MKSTKKPYSRKKPKLNPFMIKSVFESNCKRFRQCAIGDIFNLNPKTQLRRNHSINGDTYSHESNQAKAIEKL